jgi:uncharacterized membrane protein YphA (DoxX/SURF4 family)
MNRSLRLSIILLRIAMGGLLFYSGLTKVFDAALSLPKPLISAFLPDLYFWLGAPDRLSSVNTLYEWALVVVGFLLLIGLLTRTASIAAMVLVLFSYLPSLPSSAHFALNENLIYILVLLTLMTARAGQFMGMDKYFKFSFLNHKK